MLVIFLVIFELLVIFLKNICYLKNYDYVCGEFKQQNKMKNIDIDKKYKKYLKLRKQMSDGKIDGKTFYRLTQKYVNNK